MLLLRKTVWQPLKILSIELTYKPGISCLGIVLRKKHVYGEPTENRYTTIFTAVFILMNKKKQKVKQPKYSSAKWMIRNTTEQQWAIERIQGLTHSAPRVDRRNIILRDRSQKEKIHIIQFHILFPKGQKVA